MYKQSNYQDELPNTSSIALDLLEISKDIEWYVEHELQKT